VTSSSWTICQPQGAWRTASDRSGWCDAAVSACLLAGLQPIEMAFSKFKALLRAAAARTINDLWEAIRLAIGAFKPSECQNYFVAAGYDAI